MVSLRGQWRWENLVNLEIQCTSVVESIGIARGMDGNVRKEFKMAPRFLASMKRLMVMPFLYMQKTVGE